MDAIETSGRGRRSSGARRTVALLALGWCLWAGAAVGGLSGDVVAAIGRADLGATEVSVLVQDARTGGVLVEVAADRAMVPASNMKLVTTAAALGTLGADFTFTTRLQAVPGEPQRAQGDDEALLAAPTRGLPTLVVRGDGDPGFGDPTLLAHAGFDSVDDFLQLWVDAVVETGLTHFGRLVVDDRVFDAQFVHPDWPEYDLPRRWCAQVAGLSFYDNVLDVRPIPAARAGLPPSIEMYPFFPALQDQTLNRARTGKVDAFVLDRQMGSNRFVFRGTVRQRRDHPFQVTVHDPPLFFADYFRYRLALAGVRVDEVRRAGAGARFPEATTLHAVNTTLAGVVDRTNQDSQNMFAESLLKRMGYAMTRRPGSFESGAAAVGRFLREGLGGSVALTGVVVSDGSGMSRHNRVSARLLVELLVTMYRDPALGPPFTASLSHAGHSGTLRRRLGDLTGQVYGKSGYLGPSADFASGLSGYLVTPDGRAGGPPRVLAFSLLFNGFKPPLTNGRIKDLQDEILRLVDAHVAGAAVR